MRDVAAFRSEDNAFRHFGSRRFQVARSLGISSRFYKVICFELNGESCEEDQSEKQEGCLCCCEMAQIDACVGSNTKRGFATRAFHLKAGICFFTASQELLLHPSGTVLKETIGIQRRCCRRGNCPDSLLKKINWFKPRTAGNRELWCRFQLSSPESF